MVERELVEGADMIKFDIEPGSDEIAQPIVREAIDVRS